MKARIFNPFLLPVLIAGLVLILTGPVTAQTFKTLHSFTATSGFPLYTNSDGANPQAGLILSDNTLYGTTEGGGTNGTGAVFSLNTNGTNFMTLHSFGAVVETSAFTEINSDGSNPSAGLILSGNTLYGTAQSLGTNGSGTVFALSTNGMGFTTPHSFSAYAINGLDIATNSDGFQPEAGLILSGSTLYGTASMGGTNGSGTVFALNINDMSFTNLHIFSASLSFNTNSDGAFPQAGLILSGSTLYGTATGGGANGNGTVYAVSTYGSNFITLHDFSAEAANPLGIDTNSDGANPQAGLILSGNTLYGTTIEGGTNGTGAVFSLNTNGTNFMTLHSFTAEETNQLFVYTNSDGANPKAGLILSGNTLYGTTTTGGANGNGTVFKVNTNGADFATVYTFSVFDAATDTTNSDGANPEAGLILSGNTLYGTTVDGGTKGNGTVFSILLGSAASTPQLTILRSGTNFIVTWPTNATGFTLQSSTNLSPAVWSTVSPGPVVVNGQNTVTNLVSGARKFYRLLNP